jgi:hypothetical protein
MAWICEILLKRQKLLKENVIMMMILTKLRRISDAPYPLGDPK